MVSRAADFARRPRVRAGGAALLLAATCGALGVHARHYWPFLSDDALISLRYAERLASGHGLTWSDAERAEGYTDLLWVLLTALAAKLGFGLVASARALDALGAVTAIAAVSCSPKPLALRSVRVLTGGLALALCAPLAVWAIGALEHGFMAGVIAVALLLLSRALEPGAGRRALLGAGGLLAAIALLRADGVVLVFAAVLAAFLCGGFSLRSLGRAALLASLPVLVLLLQLAFRVAYYGETVPNTALAKVNFNRERLLQGWHYVIGGATPLWPMLLLCALLCLAGARGLKRERWVPALLMTLGWSAYQVLVGGDIFPAWRQLLPAIVPVGYLIAEGAEAASARWRYGALAAPIAAVPLLAFGLRLQTADGGNRRGVTERWEFGGYSVGPLLARAFGDKHPLLAVDAAGALPFWSGLECIDMLGLNDKYLAKHPPRSFGTGQIGHELGDGKYVLGRRPDIIAFNGAVGARDPMFLSGRQMIRTREFKDSYQFVRVRGDQGNREIGQLWLRREDSVLGVRRTASRVEIPGYFFAGGDAIARPASDGRLVTPVSARSPAKLPALRLPAGTWTLELEPRTDKARIHFRCDGTSVVPGGNSVALDATTKVDVLVSVDEGASLTIRSAVLHRSTAPAPRCPRAGTPVDAPLAALAPFEMDGMAWDAPDSIVFQAPGVRVRLPATSHATRIDVDLDANDTYRVVLRLHGVAVATLSAPSVRGRAGLARRRLVVPDVAALTGFDVVEIRPERGDGAYGLGQLALIE